ncbi:dynein heavy chain domain-containing 1-like [Brachionus plicatilis]|uniref:Dynein heavy chain domain-containing 1-like n=1 Tax=Brachionus plicatilis TaxID=10195 RepID=A0A3M7RD05_BRAPC|nr:dynein heavy chain domain-containing 1-like [Brachionus plicatilis]
METNVDGKIKLPSINSRNNLLKLIPTNEPDINKTKQLILRVQSKIECGQLCENDLHELKTDLIKTIVNALMNNSDRDWNFLHDYLKNLIPISKLLENDRRINHYFHRIHCLSNRKDTNSNFKEFYNLLRETFPNLNNSKQTNQVSFNLTNKNERSEKIKFEICPDPIINFYDGKLDPYSNKIREIKIKPPTGPHMKEIKGILSKVTNDSFKSETNWKEKDSRMVLATSLDLDQLEDDYEEKLKKEAKSRSFFEYEDDDEPTFDINRIEKFFSRDAPDFEEKCLNLTGREMVFYLLKSTHLANAVSFYLNKVESKLYRPYDLITVPPSQANREHFIFSVFGVLHVISGEESERLTLDEWNRFAVLWEACSKIKFFKQFLFRKFFSRWRVNSKFSQFLKLKNKVSKNIIISIPFYHEALIHISKLIQSICDIKFLPEFNDTIVERQSIPNKHNLTKGSDNEKKLFTLDKFLKQVNEYSINCEQILEYFFIYVKYVLNHTRQRYFDKLRFYEALVHQARIIDVNKSMSIQKEFRTKAESDLDQVHHEINLLGNFVSLVSYQLGSNILQIIRQELIRFLREFDLCNHSDRGPLFFAELGFDKEDKVNMVPNADIFVIDIMKCIKRMLNAVIYASQIIDYEGTIKDKEKYGKTLIDYKIDDDEEISDEISQKLEDRSSDYYYENMIDKIRNDLPVQKPELNFVKGKSILDKIFTW